MPSPTTALDVIKASMRHIAVIATGETPTAAEASDALGALSDVIETWSTEGLMIWGTAAVAFQTVAGQSKYTIGATGNWATARPISIDSGFASYSGVDFPLMEITQVEYDDMALKTGQTPFPDRFCYVNDFPLGVVYLWPAPTAVVTVSLNLVQPLASIASTSQALSYPPGYARALQWALAVEIAPQFGVALSQIQVDLAKSTKAALKRANRGPRIAKFDPALTSGGGEVVVGATGVTNLSNITLIAP